MLGDEYHVFTSTGCHTTPAAVCDSWQKAKEVRNEAFFNNADVQSAWVMRSNPGLNLRQDKYGNTLRKEKHR